MKLSNGTRPHSSGLSLVEVIVTMVIIGILAGILVPAAQRMRSNALSTQCAGNLREIGIGLNNYFLDKGMIFPSLVAARESRDDDAPALDTVLLDYVNNEEMFRCPADHGGIFAKTGSSYFWNSLINGQRLGNMDLMGLVRLESGIPIVSDKENFHQHVGDGVNVLYADGHVMRELQFVVDRR